MSAQQFLIDWRCDFIFIIRMKKVTEYPKLRLEERQPKNQPNRQPQRAYDSFKGRLDSNPRDTDNRKHNSPDYNKYRQANENRANYQTQPKGNYNKVRFNSQNEEKQQRLIKRQRDEEGVASKKGRELNKNASNPNLSQYKQAQIQEAQEYQKLHQKLNFIQNKIADMKRHVQKKREEKQKIVEAKRERERKREEEERANQQQEKAKGKKVDLKQFVTSEREHKELHTFENNPYSPNHNIYYISEIIKSYRDQKSLGREHLLTSLHILKILEHSKFATADQMRQRQVKLPRRKGYEGKKSVIFDLDETLIHCNDTLTPPYDIKLPITFPTGEVIEAGINVRPHAQQILKNLSRHFEVIVFTASHSCYANVVLDYLDPNNEYVQHRLFREHCFQTPEGMYCKDLRVLDRELSDIVLVDNAAYSYSAQLDNGIPILPYYHGKADFQLKALERYLLGMVLLKDVRVLNRKTFQLHNYRNYYSEPERLVEELYMSEESA